MSLPDAVAKLRYWYHSNMLDVNNALNQLHIISDERADDNNRKHCMTIFTGILPRLGYDVSSIFKDNESE